MLKVIVYLFIYLLKKIGYKIVSCHFSLYVRIHVNCFVIKYYHGTMKEHHGVYIFFNEYGNYSVPW